MQVVKAVVRTAVAVKAGYQILVTTLLAVYLLRSVRKHGLEQGLRRKD